MSRAYDTHEHGFVIVGNAAWVRSEIRAPRRVTFDLLSTRELHALDGMTHLVFRRVAVDAAADCGEVSAARDGVIAGVGDRSENRLGRGIDQTRDVKRNLGLRHSAVEGLERADVNDHRGEIFVGQIAIILVRHDREQRTAVVSDAFADGACQLIVGPGTSAGFSVGRDVRRSDDEATLIDHHAAAAPGGEGRRNSRRRISIEVRVTIKAAEHSFNQVLAVLQAPRRALEVAIGQRPAFRAQHRSPADCNRDEHGHNRSHAVALQPVTLFHLPELAFVMSIAPFL